MDEENASQDDPLLQLEIENLCTFAVDDELPCVLLPTTTDIASSVRQTLKEADENDDAGDPLPLVTYGQAYFALQELRSYLLHSSPSENLYRHLGDLETEVFKAGSNTCVQTMIRDYFQ